MKIVVQRFLYCIGKISGWRWLALISGVALLTSCSSKTVSNKDTKDSSRDIERVTCYEPTVLNDSTSDTLN